MKATTTTKRSCSTCPSLLSRTKQAEVLGKDTGAPVCGVKLIPLGRPNDEDQTKAIQVQKASNCASYGTRLDIDPAAKQKPIAVDIAIPTPIDPPKDQRLVSSCTGCEHYMGAREVRKRYGWSTGMCTAKGQLILDNRLSMYARDCEKRSYQPPNTERNWDIVPILIFPEYQEGWGKVDPMKTLAAFAAKNSNPFAYPTDRPVSAKASEIGVRAWRRVQDPDGEGPDVFLPIFDTEGWEKTNKIEFDKVPKEGDDERPNEYVDYMGYVYQTTVLWTRLGMTPALWGLPGTGKTEFLRHMAYLMALPFERMSITASTELEYLEGKILYNPNEGTYFQYGRIPQAWAKPNVLCLDEANLGQPAVWQFLRPLTDNSRQLVLDANKGETIKAHAGCYLAFAMNPAWDPRNVGAMELGAADGSRLMHLEMTLPPAEVEQGIIRRALSHDRWEEADAKKTAALVYNISKQVRSMSEEGSIPITFGIRDSIKFARAMRYFGPHKAMRVAVSNALEPAQAHQVLDIINQFVES